MVLYCYCIWIVPKWYNSGIGWNESELLLVVYCLLCKLVAVFSYVYKYRNMIFRIGEQFTSYSDIESRIDTYSKQHYASVVSPVPLSSWFPCLEYIVIELQYLRRGYPTASARLGTEHMFGFMLTYFVNSSLITQIYRPLMTVNSLIKEHSN